LKVYLKVYPTLVSAFAQEKGLTLLRPASLKTNEILETLEKEQADFFIVADYGKILPPQILTIPKVLPLAIHPSILPRYRGPAPINWALINGDKETGISIFKINEQVDEGDIILQKNMAITETDDVLSLTTRLAIDGAACAMEVMEKIKNNNYALIRQNQSSASYDRKLKKEDGRIDWNLPSLKIVNLVHGTSGWPSAYTRYRGKIIKILEAETSAMETDNPAASIVKIDSGGIYVAAEKSAVKIKKVKLEGKNEMSAWAFSRGHRISVGEKFG